MFPFQQNNESLSSQISSNNPHQDFNPLMMLMGDDLQPPLPPPSNSNGCDDTKKIIRKEIERQRRQQMSTLHASLRSLLPLQSLKGKRSISDHINEAAKYIKDLENNVKELSFKRDKLKNLSNSTSIFLEDDPQLHNNLINTTNYSTSVTVRSHVDGAVEIVVSCGYGEDSFLLSRVLQAVVEEGFDVLSCISTKRDAKLYITVQSQPTHVTCIDPTALQQKLNHVIFSS